MVNVIEPGEPSCANGWNLYKNSCFMHSARSVTGTWDQAYVYCNGSSAQLAKVSGNSDALNFMSDLAKRRNASNVWIGSSRGPRSRFLGQCATFDGHKRAWTKSKCTQVLPFICEREVPKDVTIEQISSSTARVRWTMTASGNTVTSYYVELSTSSSGNVVSRKSSSKERSLLLTDLQPNIQYRVRVAS
ncbi:Lymphocyte antigen 75 [Desmophyllum pertusum]|uniref:Lymphocyte antigen 75 n=1 Tax=Desmophyllum pertusum TaxID=174260 RepID=A0A9W9Z6P7_9CNID|nr:Lymphocyte antigen 75 [Desmophyllum pertusum]